MVETAWERERGRERNIGSLDQSAFTPYQEKEVRKKRRRNRKEDDEETQILKEQTEVSRLQIDY